jgi:hypothetical protein
MIHAFQKLNINGGFITVVFEKEEIFLKNMQE